MIALQRCSISTLPTFGCETDYGADLFSRDQFEIIAESLRTLSGKFLLSLNDHPEVRRIFDGFAKVQVGLLYSVGGGANTSEAAELIISNLDPARMAALFPDAVAVA